MCCLHQRFLRSLDNGIRRRRSVAKDFHNIHTDEEDEIYPGYDSVTILSSANCG